MNYTLNEESGKTSGESITLHGDTLEAAVAAAYPSAVVGTIYDRPRGCGKTYTVREWDGKYANGRSTAYVVLIPLSDVKRIAAAAGMSCRKLAERFDIPYRTMENWSSGVASPPPYVLAMMREILGV